MLVLTRKRHETILIGDEIVVKVIRTGKGTVKIGIEAPAHVRVIRGEICDTPEPAREESAVGNGEQASEIRDTTLLSSVQFVA